MIDIIEKLKKEMNYTEYKQLTEAPYILNTLLQKKVESESVCETNDKLCIDIKATSIELNNNKHEGFEISVRAEKHGKWWILSCYSLSKDEILNEINEIEVTLIRLFNCL